MVKVEELVEQHKELLKDYDKRIDDCEHMLADNKAQFAVISYKLNLIMGILGVMGTGVAGVIINMIFG